MSRNTHYIMKMIFISLVLLLSTSNTMAFELDKYLGTWHEIYSIPNRFQKDCYNVTAEYSLKQNKNIKVINTCRDKNGEFKKEIEGEAVVKDLSKKYLKVYFFRPFGINLFGGDYYILAIEENYNWALVGTLDFKYGWVLSRSPSLKKEELDLIKKEAERLGFNWDKFEKTNTTN